MERPFGVSYLTLSAREALKPAARWGRAGARSRRRHPRRAGAREQAVMLGAALAAVEASVDRDWTRRRSGERGGDPTLAREWNLPVAVTPKIKGIVDETSANFVGVVGGMAADGVMCDAIAAADLVVGFGLDPVEIDKTWHAERPIHWLLESPNACGIVPAGATLVNHRALLDALLDEQPPRAWSEPFRAFQDRGGDVDRSDAEPGRCGPATSSTRWRR